MPRAPENTTGGATGIGGNRLGGLTTFLDAIGAVLTGEEQSLLSEFGVITATKVIGSAFADTHMLGSAPKEYVIGAGDSLVRPTQPDLLGIDLPDFLLTDVDAIGQTTIRFDDSVIGGVMLDLRSSSGNLVINGLTSSIFSPTDLSTPDDEEQTFGYRVFSSAGDDHFIGSDKADTYLFESGWGNDTLDLSGNAKDQVDVLDFSAITDASGAAVVTGRWNGHDLVFEEKNGNTVVSSVTVVNAALAADEGKIDWIGVKNAVPAVPPIGMTIGGAGTPLLSATPGALTPLDVATIESSLLAAMQAFDGKTITPLGELTPVTLQVQDVVAGDGSTVRQILRSDTNAVLLSSSDFGFAVGNLDGTALSVRDAGGTITFDATAADHGWHTASGEPVAGVDLLSVLLYEIGLELGLDPSLDVMNPTLTAGLRSVVADDLGAQIAVVDNFDAVSVDALPAGSLTAADNLNAILARAIEEWSAQSFLVAGEPWADPTAVLNGVTITIADLDGDELARTLADGSIVLDYTAAGHGWFVDPTPGDDLTEFADVGGELVAIAGGPAEGRIDLLTALMHEFGHRLGVSHDGAAGALMATTLGTGIRRDIPGGVISYYEIDADGQQALTDGMSAFIDWADGLGAQLDTVLDDTAIPFTDQSLRDLLDIDASVESMVSVAVTALRDALIGLSGSGNITAVDILGLSGLGNSDYTIDVSRTAGTNPNAFLATINLLPGSTPLANLDLSGFDAGDGPLQFTIDGGLALTVTADLELSFEFGLDNDDTFFVAAPELTAGLAVTSGACPSSTAASI